MINTHFAQRCRERGIHTSCPDAVWRELVAAIANPDAHGMMVDHVQRLPDGKDIWRFAVPEGIFYAIVADGRPVTVITQRMVAAYKAVAKGVVPSIRVFEQERTLGVPKKAMGSENKRRRARKGSVK